MPKIVDEGGKNADSGSGSNAANSEIDPLDNIPGSYTLKYGFLCLILPLKLICSDNC